MHINIISVWTLWKNCNTYVRTYYTYKDLRTYRTCSKENLGFFSNTFTQDFDQHLILYKIFCLWLLNWKSLETKGLATAFARICTFMLFHFELPEICHSMWIFEGLGHQMVNNEAIRELIFWKVKRSSFINYAFILMMGLVTLMKFSNKDRANQQFQNPMRDPASSPFKIYK